MPSSDSSNKSNAKPMLCMILGDQLDLSYPDHLGLDKDRDVILMAEVAGASDSPPSHVQRTVTFLSAMRHHAEALRDKGWAVDYIALTDRGNTQSFKGELGRAIKRHKPGSVRMIETGSYGVTDELTEAASDADVSLEFETDPHFLSTKEEFHSWADGRKSFVMEFFYREQRRKLNVLMTDAGKPEGGDWNYDKENRKTFKRAPEPPPMRGFEIDDTTAGVIKDVEKKLGDLPGRLFKDGTKLFWPVTREQALRVLNHFIRHKLPGFGDYQDAMWTGERTLWHACISVPINLKLLNPREVYEKAIAAYESGDAPLNSVEGFVRQIIGWREFIRGVYFFEGKSYERRNGLRQHGSLPDFYWTGDTNMKCMSQAIGGVLDMAYGHHIERLMVTGNFAMIAGVHPGEVNDWYLGMYADAVDWVTTPNTLGMAMHADHGVVGTKPYAASGKYISKMSNYCKSCGYDLKKRSGEDACPFNVFYWDFLIRNEETFSNNQRMALIMKNVTKLKKDERVEITTSARRYRDEFGIGPISN